ncbi:MAG: hypothetical protein HY260_06170 [Chloroflexi bacterium]|nr:hypothetical protein [Chloroflexota bacterium]
MTETSTTSQAWLMSDDQFKKLIAVLIAGVATLIAVIAFLQSDASARDDRANRDTKRYSMQAMGRQVGGEARANYDYDRAYQAYYEFDLLAESAANVGDEAAARRYESLRDRMKSLSPLLAAPYFDPASGEVNIARYEADTYVVETTALTERFLAASKVKDAWDYKSNTYIIHVTLLAVALFLYGLSATLSGRIARWIFTGTGTLVALVGVGWAALLFAQPVPDLRDCKTADGAYAIDAFAQGVGLAYQNQHDQAVASFDKALACAPDYSNAHVERGNSNMALGKYAAAASDFEKAQASGDQTANVAGELAWAYYLQGRFDDAVNMNRTALKAVPDELWIRFDLGLSLLASGQIDGAKSEYADGMKMAAQQVADAKAAGAEPPSYLWWSLDDGAISLEDLVGTLEAGTGNPPPQSVANPDAVKEAATEVIGQLKSLAVALEYSGKPPAGELAATISPFAFAEPVSDDQGNVVDYNQAESFAYGIDDVSVLFDYSGMQDGQDVVFKVYVDDQEDPSWRIAEPWSLGASGSAEKPISFAYSNVHVLRPGEYAVEMYVASHLAQRGKFVVEPGS